LLGLIISLRRGFVMHRYIRILPVVLGSALTILLLGCFVPAEAGEEIPAAQTVWQHVGRFYVNPRTGQSVFAGYVVHLNGFSASLFNGPPSEATAHFTFSTDVISLTPIPSNGDLSLDLVSAGTFNVYYNANPNGNWSDPTTFSSGQLVATFARRESLFLQFTTVGVHPVSETLQSSQTFIFNGQSLNFKQMVPHGITFTSYLSTNALTTGFTNYPLAFAAAGSTIAVGGELSD
jgi:hypothetical protein